MALLQRLQTRGLRAGWSSERDPADDRWYQSVGRVAQGLRPLSADEARTLSAVWAAMRLLGEGIARLPCHLMRRVGRHKERAVELPLYRLLRWMPNRWQTAFEFWEYLVVSWALWGNGYASIVTDAAGTITQLIPRVAARMRVEQLEHGTVRYQYTDERGRPHTWLQHEMLHLRGMSDDGLTGLAPKDYGARSLGRAVAAEAYAARFFNGGAQAALAVIHKDELGDVGLQNLRKQVELFSSGLGNAHSVLPLEEGVTVQNIAIDPEKAQLILAQVRGVHDVARIWNIPIHKLQEGDKAQTYSSVEQHNLGWLTDTLQPISTRIEQTIFRDLLTESERDELFAEFLFDVLQRADTKTRYDAHKTGILAGFITRNEAREMENRNPIDGLDEPIEPSPTAAAAGEQGGTRSGDADRQASARRSVRAAQLALEAAARAHRREIAELHKAAEKFAADPAAWRDWLQSFYTKHAAYLAETLHLPPTLARAFAVEHRRRLEAGGAIETITEDWAATDVPALAALALEGAESCTTAS